MDDVISHPTGLTKSTGWQVGARRTLSVPSAALWDFLLSKPGREIWLGIGDHFDFSAGSSYRLADGTSGEITVFIPGSHWRMTRRPPDPGYSRPSTIQVRVIDQGSNCILAFHEEHLPSSSERQARKAFYSSVLERIKSFSDGSPAD